MKKALLTLATVAMALNTSAFNNLICNGTDSECEYYEEVLITSQPDFDEDNLNTTMILLSDMGCQADSALNDNQCIFETDGDTLTVISRYTVKVTMNNNNNY